MQVTRLDLDGTGSPLGLVDKILRAEPELKIPVPIEDLAIQLDISEIAELQTEGFEGGLITDAVRSSGAILVRRGTAPKRRRFTIGHELGHFLISTHQPIGRDSFLCSNKDMHKWDSDGNNRAVRMESEANRFAAAILLPPPHLRTFMAKSGIPDLSSMLSVHEHFDVSKEVAARAYATHHRENVAIAIVHDGRILRIYRQPTFPRLTIRRGDKIPPSSSYRPAGTAGAVSTLRIAAGEQWLETNWGNRAPRLYEQFFVQSQGFGMIMLWAEASDDEDYDPDGEKTAKERYRDRMAARFSH